MWGYKGKMAKWQNEKAKGEGKIKEPLMKSHEGR
jgi:hypothetical protein